MYVNRRTDGQTDGWTYAWIDGRTDRTHGRTNARTNPLTDAWTNIMAWRLKKEVDFVVVILLSQIIGLILLAVGIFIKVGAQKMIDQFAGGAIQGLLSTLPLYLCSFSTQFLYQTICTRREPRRGPSNHRLNEHGIYITTLPGIELTTCCVPSGSRSH